MLAEQAAQRLNREFRGREIVYDPHDWFGGASLGIGVSWADAKDSGLASIEVKITGGGEFPGEGVIIHILELDSGNLLGQAEIQRELVHHGDDSRTYALKARFYNIPPDAVCSMQATYI